MSLWITPGRLWGKSAGQQGSPLGAGCDVEHMIYGPLLPSPARHEPHVSGVRQPKQGPSGRTCEKRCGSMFERETVLPTGGAPARSKLTLSNGESVKVSVIQCYSVLLSNCSGMARPTPVYAGASVRRRTFSLVAHKQHRTALNAVGCRRLPWVAVRIATRSSEEQRSTFRSRTR